MTTLQDALMVTGKVTLEKHNCVNKIMERVNVINKQLDYLYTKHAWNKIERLEEQKEILNNW